MELNYKLKNKSFSLMELIITIAILSIGMVTILQALAFSVRLTGLSCDMLKATLLAEDKLQELEFKEKQSAVLAEQGITQGNKDKFQWQYSLAQDRELKLYKLDLTISWQRANRPEKLRFETYLR